ncbi:MAG: TonB-dependent receptor [Stagnimonas sp.]|nr:TonB-dependent receptor [Stagnimonas sp.]
MNTKKSSTRRRYRIRSEAQAMLLIGLLTLCQGAAAAELSARELGDLSLDQLMNETVTSVSKKEESLFDAAAAVSVLSNDELRRGGAQTIADALRVVPGVNVGSVNASQWSISARGFNTLYANKLLVLVDGRAVYTPLFAGVYWDLQQTMLEDVDRIEVIRGPGATVWGANAVNGVINVVSRKAQDSQGGLLQVSGGNVQEASAGARYGGRIGEHTHYRVFAGYQGHADFPLSNGQDAGDRWESRQAGFRIDHELEAGSLLTWQADATGSDLDADSADGSNVNTIGRWTRQWSNGSSLEVQGYYDHSHRDEPQRGRNTVDTADLGLQHGFDLSARNALIWGLGYRHIAVTLDQTNPAIAVRGDDADLQIFSAFVQNEFTWIPDRLNLTTGIKVEHNDFTGVELQPSLRASFKPDQRQTLWSAVSRAARTPSVIEGGDQLAIAIGAPFTGPDGGLYVPTLVGNPELKSEILWAYELGYRVRPAERLSIDLASFYNRYRHLISFGAVQRLEPGTPVGTAEVPFNNSLSGETYGAETSVSYAATDHWRLITTYSWLVMNLDGPASSDRDSTEHSSPRNQASLRSSYDFAKRGSVDAQLRYVDSIQSVPAYITADLRLSYRLLKRLECSLVGQNLFDPQHPEQSTQFYAIGSEVPRGIYGNIAWSF